MVPCPLQNKALQRKERWRARGRGITYLSANEDHACTESNKFLINAWARKRNAPTAMVATRKLKTANTKSIFRKTKYQIHLTNYSLIMEHKEYLESGFKKFRKLLLHGEDLTCLAKERRKSLHRVQEIGLSVLQEIGLSVSSPRANGWWCGDRDRLRRSICKISFFPYITCKDDVLEKRRLRHWHYAMIKLLELQGALNKNENAKTML